MTDRRTVIAALAALAAPALQAQTAPFPSRMIRIVPFGTAGGPIDGTPAPMPRSCTRAGGRR